MQETTTKGLFTQKGCRHATPLPAGWWSVARHSKMSPHRMQPAPKELVGGAHSGCVLGASVQRGRGRQNNKQVHDTGRAMEKQQPLAVGTSSGRSRGEKSGPTPPTGSRGQTKREEKRGCGKRKKTQKTRQFHKEETYRNKKTTTTTQIMDMI